MTKTTTMIQVQTRAGCIVAAKAFLLLLAVVGCCAEEGAIARVQEMPDLPHPYVMRDWRQVTLDYLDLVSDEKKTGDHLPLVRWSGAGNDKVWMPSFIGSEAGPEGVNYLAAVVSGSLAGRDMRNYRGHDWVAVSTNFFSPEDGVFLNWPRGRSSSGESLWYDVFPNVLYFQIAALHPKSPRGAYFMKEVADKWCEATVQLKGGAESAALPNFDHTGFDLRAMQPRDNGRRIEPEGAAGVAWLEYMAWRNFNEPQYLDAADWAIGALLQKPSEANPLYEVLLPYAALTAARMNAELGRDYDVSKLVNWCFSPGPAPQARPNWGVITGSWSGQGVDGLVGSVSDGGGYAFAMNTFHYAGVLAPLARYDERFATDIGKWLLNLANSARLFYANAHSPSAQTSYDWSAAHDPHSVIAYEGLRRWKRSSSATAVADYRTAAGKVVEGDHVSTHYYREGPVKRQVLEESHTETGYKLDHVWEFELPSAAERYLVVAAGTRRNLQSSNGFNFSYSTDPNGEFTPAFRVSGVESPKFIQIPDQLAGKLYVRVESAGSGRDRTTPERIAVDAMAISYQSHIGPFAQGDMIVSFVSLVNHATVPIVLYRPAKAATDFSIYGSSHVGYLGGLLKPTNVEGILQVDLLRTDFFRAQAFPTFLYYNPHTTNCVVKVDVGSPARNIYDALRDDFVVRNVRGEAEVEIPARSACVLVSVPAASKLTRAKGRLEADGVVVDYRCAPSVSMGGTR